MLYLEKLAAQSIEDSNVREQFIDDVLAESRKTILGHEKEIKKTLFNFVKSSIN